MVAVDEIEMADVPETAQEERKHQPDEDELAIQLSQEWKERVQYFHGDWHVYESGAWFARQQQEINMEVRKYLRKFRSNGIRVTRRRVTSLAAMAQDDCFIPDRSLIAKQAEQRKYVNMRNGLYNIAKDRLEPHKPELMFTSQVPFAYEEGADCPTFKRYLRTSLVGPDGKTDEQMIQLVLEAIGYSMTARTDMKASFWLVGAPDSGKSTLVSILRELLGPLHTTIDLNQMAANRFILSQIVGKRAVTFTETSAAHMLPDALYKAVVGGTDEIYADVKNKTGISFVPEAKLWWAMNAPPRISDRSGATFNRLHVILFNKTIPQSERIPNLVEKCAEELPGIFDWARYRLQRLMRSGKFTQPKQSIEWKANFELENDTERTFIIERCEQQPDGGSGYRVQAQQFYNAYSDWCRTNGFKAKNANQASKDWERLGLEKTTISGKRYYLGVSLREL